MTSRPRHSAERGAIVLEALVATLIIAALVAATFSSVARLADTARAGEERALAMLVARSQMAAVGAVTAVVPGRVTGVDGPFAWTVDIAAAGSGNARDGALPLARVAVSVAPRAGGPPLARLSSLRLRPQ